MNAWGWEVLEHVIASLCASETEVELHLASLSLIISDVMSELMQALVFKGTGQMAVERRPYPQPGPEEALVRVTAAGICGSELTSFSGHSTRRAPGRVFGHELAGEVVAVGPAAPPELVGERVTVNPLHSCGHCRQCRAGRCEGRPVNSSRTPRSSKGTGASGARLTTTVHIASESAMR